MQRIAWSALLVTMVLGAPAVADAAPDYYPLPTGYTVSNFGVTADGAGNIWFGMSSPPRSGQPTPSLARLIPAQSAPNSSAGIAFFPTPDPPGIGCCGNQLRSVTFNPEDGKLYYVRSDGVIGSALPANLVADQTSGFDSILLPGYQDLWDVAPSPAGGVWFTEHSASNVAPTYYGDRVAYYDGGTPVEGPNIAIQGGNTMLNGLRYDAGPAGVTVAADGTPWFVEDDNGNPGYRIAHYPGAGDTYEEYLAEPCMPTPPCSGTFTGTGLTGITIAGDGMIWFTNFDGGTVGSFDPDTHEVIQYDVSSIDPTLVGGRPSQIITAPDGTLWVTVIGGYNSPANAIVEIDPVEEPTALVYPIDPASSPLGIGTDNAGNVWFGMSGNSPGRVGRLAGVIGSGGGGPTSPPTTTPPVVAPPAPSSTVSVTAKPTAPAGPPTVLAPATVATAKLTPPQTGNGAINTNQICVGPPEARCSLIYLIKEHEYVTGFPSRVGAKKKAKKRQPRVLGTKTVTLQGGESAKVTVKLNALGKRILKGKRKVKVDFTATQKLAGGKTKVLTKKTLTLKAPKKR